MKTIEIFERPLSLSRGLLKLSPEQAATRTYCLKPYHDEAGEQVPDVYELTGTVHFKVGEVIGYAGDAENLRPDLAAKIGQEDLLAEKEAALGDLAGKLEELTKYVTGLEAAAKEKDDRIAALEAAVNASAKPKK